MLLLCDMGHFSLASLLVHLGMPQIKTFVITTFNPHLPHGSFITCNLPSTACCLPDPCSVAFLCLLSLGATCDISLSALLGLYVRILLVSKKQLPAKPSILSHSVPLWPCPSCLSAPSWMSHGFSIFSAFLLLLSSYLELIDTLSRGVCFLH